MNKSGLTIVALVTAAASMSAQSMLFTQYFNNNNPSFTDSQSSLYNWSYATANNTAMVANDISAGNTNSSSAEDLPGEVTLGRGFFFLLPQNSTEGAGATFMYTTNTNVSFVEQNNPQPDWFAYNGADPLTGKTLDDMINIRYQTRVGASGNNYPSRVAIQVNGAWYVSSTSSPLTTGSFWEDHNFTNLASETWIVGAFDGVNLDADLSDNATTLLNATDIITGYGMYADVDAIVGGASRIRMNEMELTVVPEPSTFALLAGLLALGALMVRRRKS